MQKSVFVVGLEFDDAGDFLMAAESSGRRVFTTCENPPEDTLGEVTYVPWKKTSSISARTALLTVCNQVSALNEVIFVFDAHRLSALLEATEIPDYIRASENFLMSYVHMYKEVERLFKKTGNGRIVFVLRPGELLDVSAKEPNYDTAVSVPIAMAQGAFKNFAEGVCADFKDTGKVAVTLVQDDGPGEAVFSAWLFSFLNEADSSPLRGWIRPGAKSKGLLSTLFKR